MNFIAPPVTAKRAPRVKFSEISTWDTDSNTSIRIELVQKTYVLWIFDTLVDKYITLLWLDYKLCGGFWRTVKYYPIRIVVGLMKHTFQTFERVVDLVLFR